MIAQLVLANVILASRGAPLKTLASKFLRAAKQTMAAEAA